MEDDFFRKFSSEYQQNIDDLAKLCKLTLDYVGDCTNKDRCQKILADKDLMYKIQENMLKLNILYHSTMIVRDKLEEMNNQEN